MLDALGTGVAIAPERTDAQPPLGRLLVERGLLSEEQLEFALSEHARTGLPLGQMLISLSYVTATTIAQALATQQGGLVQTEYGFATGFSPDQATAPLSLPPVSPPPTTGVAPSWTQAESAQQIAQAFPAPFPAPLPAAVVEAAVLQAAPAPPPQGPELAEASTRIMSLELELAAARQETELARQDAGLARQEMLAANAAGEELATARTRIAELEGETTLTRSALDEASRKIESLEQAALAAADGSGETELHQAQADLQQTQAQLASTTENLRAAYERLHQFEIAQALQQHPQARTASPFAWQS